MYPSFLDHVFPRPVFRQARSTSKSGPYPNSFHPQVSATLSLAVKSTLVMTIVQLAARILAARNAAAPRVEPAEPLLSHYVSNSSRSESVSETYLHAVVDKLIALLAVLGSEDGAGDIERRVDGVGRRAGGDEDGGSGCEDDVGELHCEGVDGVVVCLYVLFFVKFVRSKDLDSKVDLLRANEKRRVVVEGRI